MLYWYRAIANTSVRLGTAFLHIWIRILMALHCFKAVMDFQRPVLLIWQIGRWPRSE